MLSFLSRKDRLRRLHLAMRGHFSGPFSLDTNRCHSLLDRVVPTMVAGTDDVLGREAIITRHATETGGGATIFVHWDGDFIRLVTTLRDAEGASMQGRPFERSHPAWFALRAGRPYCGYTVVGDTKHLVDYLPIVDSAGRVIGASSVGTDLSHHRVLSVAVRIALATMGCAAVLLPPYRLLVAPANHLQPLGRAWLDAIFIGCIGVVAWLAVTRLVSRSLSDAQQAAWRLAKGDLSTQVHVDRGDEIGLLLDALNGVNRGMAGLVSGVRRSVEGLVAVSAQIASGNSDLLARTHAQAGSLEQTAAATEQLTSTVRQNAEYAAQARDFTVSTASLATDGAERMKRAVAAIEAARGASAVMTEIVSTIEGLAFQTNILALNASVEAARAGSRGRGFAVVAEEVRNLAQRSAEAAKQIKEVIAASVAQIDGGAVLVSHSGSAMAEIAESVQQVTALVVQICDATLEQSAGIEEVSRSMGRIDQITQQNAHLVDEAAAAAANMNQQTGVLEEAVQRFRLVPDRVL
jgi:methyl-accepting chemotaxis protein-2 (aspartate sensor receptor)